MEWDAFFRSYWKFYLRLEKEFWEIIQYIEFEPKNYPTYSLKLMQLLLNVGAEVDAVMKELCGIDGSNRTTIADYAKVLLSKYPQITEQKVCVFHHSLVLIPFADWNEEKPSQSLHFWNAYNEVKHNRADNYTLASLEVVANALAALFTLNMYGLNDIYLAKGNLHHNIPEENDASKLFYLDAWTERIRVSAVKYHYRVYDDDEKKEITF